MCQAPPLSALSFQRMFEASLGSPACSRTSSPSGRGSLHNSTDRDGPDRSEEAQRRALINDDPEPPPTFGPGGVAGDSRICLGEKVFRTDADF
ncbi:K+ channel tetramerization domain-containing protein [Besnoitia besnoiti]|uniref:K+ channel tetramerization domain-containing protein n=1 Tax=Besnoitia besnoiti TaxID=94643 RepID=A0A2A9MD12_BESBE|nr:K+ channel tetramerization domain-containing protein [Besnoitia besnoiti]PFH36378.1 K+ channel tetramerization domain-containing protein [Besnoitia besnoiti]